MMAIGLGCRRGASAEAIVSLVEEALALLQPSLSFRGGEAEPGTHGTLRATISSASAMGSGFSAAPSPGMTGLFTLADKRDEPGLAEAAKRLGLPLVFLDRAVLALVAGDARSCSRRVEEMFGLPGIAETAALAGAGQGAVLLVPRLASATVTCAVAGPPRGRASP